MGPNIPTTGQLFDARTGRLSDTHNYSVELPSAHQATAARGRPGFLIRILSLVVMVDGAEDLHVVCEAEASDGNPTQPATAVLSRKHFKNNGDGIVMPFNQNGYGDCLVGQDLVLQTGQLTSGGVTMSIDIQYAYILSNSLLG